MTNISDQKTLVGCLKSLQAPYDPGPIKEKSNLPPLLVNTDATNSKVSLTSKQPKKNPQISDEKSVTPECPLPVRKKTWKPKLFSSKINTLITSTSEILDQASISNGRGFCPFWTEQSKEISRKLLSPTKTDYVDLDSKSSIESSNLTEGKSWFSTKKNYHQNRNSFKTFSASLRSSVPDSTVSVVTHSKTKLGLVPKWKRPNKTGKTYKTIKVRVFPEKDMETQLFACSAQHKWYYNAYNDIFDIEHHKDQMRKAKEINDYAPTADWKSFQPSLKEYNYLEDFQDNTCFCSFQEKEGVKENRELEKKRKVEEKKKKEEENKKIKEIEKNMTKEEKKKNKEERKQKQDEERKQKPKKLRNTEKYPKPGWLTDSFGNDIETKTHERVIRGACASFVQNINSATSNYCNGNISDFKMKWKTSKDKHEYVNFTDGNFPVFLKTLKGRYSYRLPVGSPKRRTSITWNDLISLHPTVGISILQDKQTKQWFACLPVERTWFPPSDCRSENQRNTIKGEAIGLDLGMRKFLTGATTAGETIHFGDKDYKVITPLLFEINRIESKLRKNRKKNNLTDTEKDNLIDTKQRLWTRIKNLVRDLHWKTITYLVSRYEYIFLGDFQVKNCLKGNLPSLIKRILNQYSFYEFKQRLEYMCESKGRKLILVHEALTSQGCCRCGSKNNVGKSESYTCSVCNHAIDRDDNSAYNMLIKGMNVLQSKN